MFQVLHLIASWFFYFVFCLAGLDLKWDILGCFQRTSDTGQVVLKNSAQLDSPGKTLEVCYMLHLIKLTFCHKSSLKLRTL